MIELGLLILVVFLGLELLDFLVDLIVVYSRLRVGLEVFDHDFVVDDLLSLMREDRVNFSLGLGFRIEDYFDVLQ